MLTQFEFDGSNISLKNNKKSKKLEHLLFRKVLTAGRAVHHPDSIPAKPCCCYTCSMEFTMVLLKFTKPFLKKTSAGWEHMLFQMQSEMQALKTEH